MADNKILKGINFPGLEGTYYVPEAKAVKDENGYIEIQSYVSDTVEVENLDATLTKEGYAADAKAVGGALEAKAPAGFGLGSTSVGAVTLADIDGSWSALIPTGWYRLVDSTGITIDGIQFNPAHLRIESENYKGQMSITLFRDGCPIVHRSFIRGVWNPWEWISPPMMAGVEYRTTERYNGKPVYTKYINFGALPETLGQMKEAVIADDIVQVISFGATQYANGDVAQAFPLDTDSVLVQTYDGILYTEGQANAGYNTASFILKYIYPYN